MKKSASKSIQLLIVLTAPLLSVIDVFIINVAIPSIKKGLSAGDAQVQLVIAGYLLGYASFLITGGRLGDHYGRKKIFIIGMICFTVTSCLCGMSSTPDQLNIARFFQGLSASFMVPQTISIIQILFQDHKERTKAVGWFGMTLGLASVIGQFLGGFFSYFHFFIPGWRLIFFINLPIGIISILTALKYLQETQKHQQTRFDFSGVIILTMALMTLIIPLIQGRELGWPLWIVALLILSLVLFYVFILDQRKKLKDNKPLLINVSLFRYKQFNLGLIAVLFYFMVHNSYLLISTVFFQEGMDMNPFVAGNAFVLFGVGCTVSSLWSIKLVVKYGKVVLIYGVAMMVIALILQQLFFAKDVSYLLICILLTIHGFGTGLVLPSLLNVTLKSIPTEFAGAASGLYSTVQQTASALGVCIIGGLFFSVAEVHSKSAGLEKAFTYGALADVAGLIIVGALLLVLPELKNSNGSSHLAE